MADGHFPTLVSKDRDANTQTNPIFTAISDGTDLALIDASGRLSVSVDNTPAVTISGSVTVTATDLDIRDLTHVSDSVKVGDGTDFLAVNNDGSINAVVTATDLDIRDLTHATDSVKIGDGTDFLAVNNDGSINVVIGGAIGTKVHDHKAASSVAANTTDNHDYTATGGTLLVKQVSFASSGGSKAVVILDPTGANKTIWTGFIPKEGGEKNVVFEEPVAVADTLVIRVAVENRQNQSQDLYSLIEGTQL